MTTTLPLARRGQPVPWLRLVKEPSREPERLAKPIECPADAARIIRPRSSAELVEVFYVLTLNGQNVVTSCHELTRGILNSSLVHPREVYRYALQCSAAAVIVAHNHPSGNPAPSADDRAITRQLLEAGRVLDVPLLDHLIVTESSYFSFAEGGLL
jgi:DNA repair protein RadC